MREHELLSPSEVARHKGSIPQDLETVCLKCLEKEPSCRYATTKELADELGRFLDGMATGFYATILHLLGLDHERLTYRYAGRDFRLTDVAGNVVKGILA